MRAKVIYLFYINSTCFCYFSTTKCNYLLHWSVFDSISVVVVVDNIKVPHCLTLVGPSKLSIQLGFACTLCIHSEMSGFVQFYT